MGSVIPAEAGIELHSRRRSWSRRLDPRFRGGGNMRTREAAEMT
jgi:hypothetical protein